MSIAVRIAILRLHPRKTPLMGSTDWIKVGVVAAA